MFIFSMFGVLCWGHFWLKGFWIEEGASISLIRAAMAALLVTESSKLSPAPSLVDVFDSLADNAGAQLAIVGRGSSGASGDASDVDQLSWEQLRDLSCAAATRLIGELRTLDQSVEVVGILARRSDPNKSCKA